MIYFTKHAKEKFGILKDYKFIVTKTQAIETINNPDFIDYSRHPLLIAQRNISPTHLLRVVYKKEYNNKIVITFYPGKRKHYEK